MHIGDRIRNLRKTRKMSQGELAEKIGTTKQNIYKYEHGIITNIPSDKIEQLAKILDTTPGYLMGWENPHVTTINMLEGLNCVRRHPSIYLNNDGIDNIIESLSPDEIEALLKEMNIHPLPPTKKVPLLGKIACGEPITAEENIDDYVDVPEYVHADFALTCQGDSMINARIMDGDIVYVRQQPEVENGEIAAVLIDGEATLKRVFYGKGTIMLQAENPTYQPMMFSKEEILDVRILGKATYFLSKVK